MGGRRANVAQTARGRGVPRVVAKVMGPSKVRARDPDSRKDGSLVDVTGYEVTAVPRMTVASRYWNSTRRW